MCNCLRPPDPCGCVSSSLAASLAPTDSLRSSPLSVDRVLFTRMLERCRQESRGSGTTACGTSILVTYGGPPLKTEVPKLFAAQLTLSVLQKSPNI